MGYDDAYERACDRFEGDQREREEDPPPHYWLTVRYDRGLAITVARLQVKRYPGGRFRTLSEAIVAGNDPDGALRDLRAHRRIIRGARASRGAR